MKKLLAMLLAVVMALSCTLALAETTDTTATADAQAFKGITIQSEYVVDREALTKLLTDMGMDEGLIKIIDAIAAVIDETSEKAVIGPEGMQCELLLKDTSLINLVGKINDNGFVIGSNLFPNYVISASPEEIFNLFLTAVAAAQEQAEAEGAFDFTEAQQALTKYFSAFVDACSAAIIPGEPQQGDFVQDGVKYNVMVPMKVDLPTIVDATNELVENLKNDEAIQYALLQLAMMGVDVNMDDSGELIDKATLPAVNVETYMNVDEQGNQSDPTQVSVYVTPAGETNPATTVITKVNGDNLSIDAQFKSGETNNSMLFTMDRDPQDPVGIKGRLDIYLNDFYIGAAAVTSSNDQGILFDAYEYVGDTEKAITEEHGSITMNGEITLGISDKATVLTLTELTGEDSGSALGGLGMDLLLNGLGSVLTTATELMPDEIGSITSLFMGDSDTAEKPAA